MSKPQKYFGTDGIRGKAGEGKLSKESIAHLSLAFGQYLQGRENPSVVIGRDTRESCLWMQELLVAGLLGHGVDVKLLGVLPTAATSFLTRELGADLGIMITASHNPAHDNGLKLFGRDGRKIDDEIQLGLEALIASDLANPKLTSNAQTQDLSQEKSLYVDMVLSSVPDDVDLSELSVVLDCANGAAFETAPEIMRGLGVKNLIVLGDAPDGKNINLDCGSTRPEKLCAAVIDSGADIGIAMDGDADRLIMCDENGVVINGDQTLAALALNWLKSGRLNNPCLVTTVMSNLGLERLMTQSGIELERTAVGDRHVAAAMRAGGHNLGGEQSGHILMPDFLPTGDGMLAVIQILSVLMQSGQPASRALSLFTPAPQYLINVRYDGKSPLERKDVQDEIEIARTEFGDNGRILIRVSGTEPVIRVMTEGDDNSQVESLAQRLAELIESAG